MFVRNFLIGSSLALWLVSCSPPGNDNDFDKVCGYFQELDQLAQVDTMTKRQRNDFIVDKINSNLATDSNARAAWMAIVYAVPEERYDQFKDVVESLHTAPWSCPAMAKWAAATGE